MGGTEQTPRCHGPAGIEVTTASTDWVLGLQRRNWFVENITRNVLNRLSGPRPAGMILASTASRIPLPSGPRNALPTDPPLEWFPWRVAGDPSLIRLTADKDAMTTRRDSSRDPAREPGLC